MLELQNKTDGSGRGEAVLELQNKTDGSGRGEAVLELQNKTDGSGRGEAVLELQNKTDGSGRGEAVLELRDRGDSVGPSEPELDRRADLIQLSATINNRHAYCMLTCSNNNANIMHLFIVIMEVWLKITIDGLIYHSDRLCLAIQQPALDIKHWPKKHHKCPYNKISSQVSFNFNMHTKKFLILASITMVFQCHMVLQKSL